MVLVGQKIGIANDKRTTISNCLETRNRTTPNFVWIEKITLPDFPHLNLMFRPDLFYDLWNKNKILLKILK